MSYLIDGVIGGAWEEKHLEEIDKLVVILIVRVFREKRKKERVWRERGVGTKRQGACPVQQRRKLRIASCFTLTTLNSLPSFFFSFFFVDNGVFGASSLFLCYPIPSSCTWMPKRFHFIKKYIYMYIF